MVSVADDQRSVIANHCFIFGGASQTSSSLAALPTGTRTLGRSTRPESRLPACSPTKVGTPAPRHVAPPAPPKGGSPLARKRTPAPPD